MRLLEPLRSTSPFLNKNPADAKASPESSSLKGCFSNKQRLAPQHRVLNVLLRNKQLPVNGHDKME
jgi:hypothetical protein